MLPSILLHALAAAADEPVPVEEVPADTSAEAPDDADEVVVVTATRLPGTVDGSAVATEVIDREMIERSGADTLAQLLEMQAGVQVFQTVGVTQGVRIRGHETRHVLILVDGQRTVGRVNGSVDLQRFDLARIERVEIIKGASSALYGSDALGGVINLVTRGSKSPWHAEAGVEAGGYASPDHKDARTPVSRGEAASGLDQLRIDAGLGLDQGPVNVRADAAFLGYDPFRPDGPSTVISGIKQVSAGARLAFRLPERARLGVRFDWMQRDADGTDSTATGAVLDRLNRTETYDLTLSGETKLAEGWRTYLSLHGGLFRDQLRTDQRESDRLDAYTETSDRLIDGRAQVVGQLHPRHTISLGAEVLLEQLVADRLVDGKGGRQRGALFAQWEARPANAAGLVLLPGVRVDVDSRFGAFASPKLAVRLDPVEALTLQFSGGVGYRAPDFRDLFLYFENPGVNYRVEGNPDLRPERSVGGTLDITTRPHDLVTIGVSAWADSVRNLIQAELAADATPNSPQVYSYVNVGRARIAGAAFTTTLGDLSTVLATLTYTFTHTRDIEADLPLSGRPEHQGTLSLTGEVPVVRLLPTLRTAVVGPRSFTVAEESVIVPTYLNLDLQLAWAWKDRLRLYVGVDNLLDAGDRVLDPLRPRRVYGGVSTTFDGRRRPRPTPEVSP